MCFLRAFAQTRNTIPRRSPRGKIGVRQKIVAPNYRGNLSTASFDSDLTTALTGYLGAHRAIRFTPNGGTLSGQTFLVVDLNGTAGYQSGVDLVIHLAGRTSTLATGGFI